MRSTLCFLIAVLFCAPLSAQEPAKPAQKAIVEKIDLKDGDTLVFLGDSITHQCLYTQFVEDYFYTRYPMRRLHFHNAGVGGDRAKNALDRFDEDVAAFKPKYVTILLGMNDGAYRDFDAATFNTYQADMSTVLEKIAALGATAVPMTPTMFDSRAKVLRNDVVEPRNTYYNGVLALYGGWLREQALARGLGFVDMYSPLNNLTLQQRKQNANWTMIADGVHPEASGQLVMALAVLDDMVAKSSVGSILVQERRGKMAATARNGKVSEFDAGESIRFTHLANALPWVLPPNVAQGFALTNAAHRHSSERLTMRHLKPGKYEVKIDGQPIGQWTDTQLAAGVALESNDKTPQYQQALKVALLNKDRNDTAYHPIRDQWAQLKGRRRDIEKLTAANDPQLDAKKAEFEQWKNGMMEKVAALRAKAKEFEDQIYAANQPKPHTYEIALVK
ncbi:MAG TPA: GDSL-type esterase/lipase family protein [Chthoniobacteraceae bacterium]|nr:GDSL-type esterase/lipase family protein [Chthoniobacteraceae bacterium]